MEEKFNSFKIKDGENNTVFVNDQFCGAGKSQSAIEFVKKNQNYSYIFVTPYLDEIERVIRNCPDFIQPECVYDEVKKTRSKANDFINLIKQEENIVTSHSLLQNVMADSEAVDCLTKQNRVLILDEVMNVAELMNLRKDTLLILKNEGCVVSEEKTGLLKLIKRVDSSNEYDKVFDLIESGIVYEVNNQLIVWTLPVDLFKYMNKIIILTYGYQYQIMAKFFKLHGIEALYVDNNYDFDNATSTPPEVSGVKYKNLINIEMGKINDIGEKKTSMSKAWFNSQKSTKGESIQKLKRNLFNLKRNIWKCGNDNRVSIKDKLRLNMLWTVFSDFKNICCPSGMTNNFISCNLRASNDYRQVSNMAYAVNVFYNPLIVQWFRSMDVSISSEDEDKFALIEMIQYLYRSAVREGKPINVYVPSSRMRNLLIEWLGKN